jgi:hypothetical protein
MPRQPGLKLNAMSMPELLKLREQIQTALASKIEGNGKSYGRRLTSFPPLT